MDVIEGRSPGPGRAGCAVAVLLLLAGAAWLIPAVAKTREAARRSTCTGHLKGLSCALHAYSDTHGTLPAGTVANPTLPPDRRLSWYVPFLPYFEQQEAHRRFDLTAGADDPRNRAAMEHRVRHFVCPSSGEHELGDGDRWRSPAPVGHYVGVAGVGPDAATLPGGHPRAGLFGDDRLTRFPPGGVPDGLSNTLMLIETAANPGHWARGGPATVRPLDPVAAPYIGERRPFGGFHRWPPPPTWSAGRNQSAIAALADASIRAFSDATSPQLLEALATAAGGEAVALE